MCGNLTIYCEVEPRSVVPGVGRPVREDHPTLVPSLIALTDVREIDAALAVTTANRVF